MSEDSKQSNVQPSVPVSEVDAPTKLDLALARVTALFPRSGHLIKPWLDSYRETESIMMACDAAGVSRTTVGEWRKHEDFKILFTDAHLKAQSRNNDLLRKTAIQLATVGAPHFLIKNGAHVLDANGRRVIAYYDHYPQLIAFMLKNRLPNEFKDKFEHEINSQLVSALVSEFISIVKRIATPELSEKIQKELETLSAKMTAST